MKIWRSSIFSGSRKAHDKQEKAHEPVKYFHVSSWKSKKINREMNSYEGVELKVDDLRPSRLDREPLWSKTFWIAVFFKEKKLRKLENKF